MPNSAHNPPARGHENVPARCEVTAREGALRRTDRRSVRPEHTMRRVLTRLVVLSFIISAFAAPALPAPTAAPSRVADLTTRDALLTWVWAIGRSRTRRRYPP